MPINSKGTRLSPVSVLAHLSTSQHSRSYPCIHLVQPHSTHSQHFLLITESCIKRTQHSHLQACIFKPAVISSSVLARLSQSQTRNIQYLITSQYLVQSDYCFLTSSEVACSACICFRPLAHGVVRAAFSDRATAVVGFQSKRQGVLWLLLSAVRLSLSRGCGSQSGLEGSKQGCTGLLTRTPHKRGQRTDNCLFLIGE